MLIPRALDLALHLTILSVPEIVVISGMVIARHSPAR
jgi:hypothetical protein